jgi:hypothetical protein
MVKKIQLMNGKIYWHCDLCDEEYTTKEQAKKCCDDERGF